jgi:hypothetical protein
MVARGLQRDVVYSGRLYSISGGEYTLANVVFSHTICSLLFASILGESWLLYDYLSFMKSVYCTVNITFVLYLMSNVPKKGFLHLLKVLFDFIYLLMLYILFLCRGADAWKRFSHFSIVSTCHQVCSKIFFCGIYR